MALIGPGLAVVSAGMSCTVAYQLRLHADRIREITGEHLEVHTTPWDWTICGPAGVAAMIADGETFPRDRRRLEARHKPYWPERECYFWHVKGAIEDHHQALQDAIGREAWLPQIGVARRRVFIVANTQNNLARQARAHGGFRVPFTAPELEALDGAILARFGPSRLHVVVHGLEQARAIRGGPWATWVLPPDKSQWSGDPGDWGKLLAEILRA